MGIHSGEPTVTEEGYVGADVHLGARICAAAWGAQIVDSSATAGLLSSGLKNITLRSLGDHALKDIDERVALYQVGLGAGRGSDTLPKERLEICMARLPSGTVTLVFTDIENSTLDGLGRSSYADCPSRTMSSTPRCPSAISH